VILSLDLGTSSLKTVLFDTAGTERWTHREPYPVRSPAENCAEHDPADVERALAESLAALSASPSVPTHEVSTVAVTGVGTGLIPLDADGEPVRREMLTYMDGRTDGVDLAPTFDDLSYGASEVFRYALWLRRTDPEAFDRTETILMSRDYLGYLLTGRLRRIEFPFRPGAVARFCDLRDLPESLFPAPHGVTEATGTVSGDLDAPFGPDTGVVVGPWDGMCAVIGSGLRREGLAMSVGGTTNIVAACVDPGTRTESIPVPSVLGDVDLYYTSDAVGIAHQWLRRVLTEEVPGGDVTYGYLDDLARAVDPADVPVFLPFLQGESMIGKPHMRGGLLGLTAEQGLGHVVRGLYEGDAFFLRDRLDPVTDGSRVRLSEIRVSGGSSESPTWNRIRADATGTTVAVAETTETTALGAAVLGAVCAGVYDTVPEGMDSMVSFERRIEPDPDGVDRLDARYERYRRLYETVDDLYG
jgi:xylulokinase